MHGLAKMRLPRKAQRLHQPVGKGGKLAVNREPGQCRQGDNNQPVTQLSRGGFNRDGAHRIVRFLLH